MVTEWPRYVMIQLSNCGTLQLQKKYSSSNSILKLTPLISVPMVNKSSSQPLMKIWYSGISIHSNFQTWFQIKSTEIDFIGGLKHIPITSNGPLWRFNARLSSQMLSLRMLNFYQSITQTCIFCFIRIEYIAYKYSNKILNIKIF